jgi:hypothetical protein
METVFTTLEHTERMIQTTGENRDFKRSEINAKKERLKQAIAATLEEALCAGGQHEGTECDYHRKLVEAMKETEEIISFNYDCYGSAQNRSLNFQARQQCLRLQLSSATAFFLSFRAYMYCASTYRAAFSASVAASINTAMKGVPEQTRRKGDDCDKFKGSPEETSRGTLQER